MTEPAGRRPAAHTTPGRGTRGGVMCAALAIGLGLIAVGATGPWWAQLLSLAGFAVVVLGGICIHAILVECQQLSPGGEEQPGSRHERV